MGRASAAPPRRRASDRRGRSLVTTPIATACPTRSRRRWPRVTRRRSSWRRRSGTARPRSAWLLARVAPAGLSPDAAARGLLAGRFEIGGHAFSDDVRAGSADPRDWVTYVHVYPRVDGGVNIQYWFFYPYNRAPLFFDHEGDWEHITVELGTDGAPRAVDFAQHGEQ